VNINWYILIAAILLGLAGNIVVLRRRFRFYQTILLIHFALSILLCLFFYYNGFYRYALPVLFILPAVVINFGLFIAFLIRFEPTKDTFRFYFVFISWTFSLEIILEHLGFIRFRNGWDYWDSYSLYWIYARTFTYIGKRTVPLEGRTPIKLTKRSNLILFSITLVLFFIVLLLLMKTDL